MNIKDLSLNYRQKAWLRQQPDAVREDFEERAAIVEYDGGKSRDAAELLAFNLARRKE